MESTPWLVGIVIAITCCLAPACCKQSAGQDPAPKLKTPQARIARPSPQPPPVTTSPTDSPPTYCEVVSPVRYPTPVKSTLRPRSLWAAYPDDIGER